MTKTSALPPLSGALALFLDFDGTLAPLQDNPASVCLSGRQLACITALARKMDNALAIVSGRDIRDLSTRVPRTLWRAGSHGLEICAPGAAPVCEPGSAPPSLVASMQRLAAHHPGTRLEQKGEVLALHYRAVPSCEADLLLSLTEILKAYPSYTHQSGKMVLEAKPLRANKGNAIRHFMSFAPFLGHTPVMVGDDATDEDAMKTVLSLGGWAVKVGDGDTVAGHRAGSPAEVWHWLSEGAL